MKPLLMALALGACTQIIPTFSQDIPENYAEGYKIVTEIIARAELGELSRASTYPDTIDDYARALAAIETARSMVLASGSGGLSDKAVQNLAAQMEECKGAVKGLAELHKLGELKPDIGLDSFQLTCSNAFLSLGGAT